MFDITYVLSPKNLSDVEGIHNTDYLIGFHQKIPDWFIKIICLGKAETEITSGIKSKFGIMGF